MTGAKVSETAFRYPYVIGWTGETQNLPLKWVPHRGGRRLSYVVSHRDDFRNDVLRLRQGQTRAGRPDFRTVNTLRQWRAMEKRLCQVCARSAVDRAMGRIWWLLSSGYGGDGDGYTNAPPTCPACIPEAISQCSHLRRNAAVFTVGDCSPYGVRADVFVPNLPPVVPFERNAVLRFDDYNMHHVLARELLMRLQDVRPAVTERRVN
ncbi:hypothetical protein [Nonomuraea sp. NEAU-A123]|uniref:hypothetical protein n=1 Tax=Nonomuraea sp. NEAU-A123 TaxID=2839649 RepID=UPI001BE422CC|nr:hypothetical protein [Nonomuraea sp. NEAU-A123]MBT2229175.1 hypothetical protein [Nonomuraea sp. NEAU-A123]